MEKKNSLGIGDLIWGILTLDNVRKKKISRTLKNVMSDNITILVMMIAFS